MFRQLLWGQWHAATLQVGRAGADDAHHRRQGRGDQARIGEWADAQHQIDLAEVLAMQIDELSISRNWISTPG